MIEFRNTVKIENYFLNSFLSAELLVHRHQKAVATHQAAEEELKDATKSKKKGSCCLHYVISPLLKLPTLNSAKPDLLGEK